MYHTFTPNKYVTLNAFDGKRKIRTTPKMSRGINMHTSCNVSFADISMFEVSFRVLVVIASADVSEISNDK